MTPVSEQAAQPPPAKGAPQRPRHIFYGWWVVFASFITSMVHSGAGIVSYGLFLIPMGAELGWSRGAMGAAITVRILAGAVGGPLAGLLCDHPLGARLLLVGSGLAGGAALFLLSSSTELWQLYLGYGVLWGLGMSIASELITSTLVAKWFVRRRSLALAVASLGLSVGNVIFIPVVSVLIEAVGWRTAWAILGVVALVLIVPLTAIVVRRQPEDLGLRPDGAREATVVPTTPTAVQPAEPVWTFRGAARTRAFWLITVAIMLARIPVQGVLVHMYPYFRDIGYEAALASGLFTVFAVSLVAAKPLWGFGMTRWNAKWAMAAMFGGSGLIILGLLAFQGSTAGIIAFVLVYPLGVGGWVVAEVMVWTSYYGRGTLGRLRGAVYPVIVVGTGLGPFLGGVIRDATGSYNGMWLLFAACWLASGALLALAPRPARSAEKPAA
ncbi:MAG: MFS transporter [Dehalococcoidia bacterium]|nr:MFS transporter [Dehalococcoidia bacterium]